MKLAPRTFRIGWDVHAWAGIVSALVLYVMFFAGAFTLFRDEIELWQERPAVTARPLLAPTFARVVGEQGLEGQRRVALRLHDAAMDVEWTDAKGEHAMRVDGDTPRPSRSRIARFLFELHFLGIVPKGIHVAGVFAAALALALVTGFVIQWKDLVAQLFRVRLRSPLRVWSSDLHKVLGVWGFPFQLFFAWSGAVLCLAYVTLWPTLASTVFHGDVRATRLAYGDLPPPPPPSSVRAPLPDLDALVRTAEARLPGLRPRWIGVQNVGDARSSVRIYGDVEGVPLGTGQILLSRDGAILGVSDPRNSPPIARVTRWFFGLHFARFSSPWRVLYALFALATCAVIATGNVVWIERRDPERSRRSTRWLESATVAVCAGFPFALAVLFAANVVLPEMRARPSLEIAAFWIAWAVACLGAFLMRARRAAAITAIAAASLFALVTASAMSRAGAVSAGLGSLALVGFVSGVRLNPRRCKR